MNILSKAAGTNKTIYESIKHVLPRICELSKYQISYREMIREAYRQETLNRGQFVVVVDDQEKVLGIVSEGDFRRAIWEGVSLEEPVARIMNKEFIYFTQSYTWNDAMRVFTSMNIAQIPILSDGTLIDVIFREDFCKEELTCSKPSLGIPVVIMAGGKGTRLDPFTRILPKPLIPIGDKPVIEIIMDKFFEQGVRDFYVSVNHKEKMIKAYFEDFRAEYSVSYLEEDRFLGTAGSLKLLEGRLKSPFIVSNCDVVIDTSYSKIIQFHNQGDYCLTIIGAMQHHVVPYGVCRIKAGGELERMQEKPQFDFLANTGLYILNVDVVSMIPANRLFDMSDLIKMLQSQARRVGVYPISGESWIDVGQWGEYKKAIEKLNYFR